MKHETPILNFIDVSSSAGFTTGIPIDNRDSDAGTNYGDGIVPCRSGGVLAMSIGMWHQYGREPKGTEGVYLEVSDVPEDTAENPIVEWRYARYAGTGNKSKRNNGSSIEGSDDSAFNSMAVGNGTSSAIVGSINTPSTNTPVNHSGIWPRKLSSLADLVGFNTEPQKLGKVAETKTIKEAVVAIPFTEKMTNPSDFNYNEALTAPGVVQAPERQFFTLSKNQINAALGKPVESTGTGGTPTPESYAGESIHKMVEAMKK